MPDYTPMEMFYLGCAIAGGGMFVLRSIAMVAGMGGDEHHGDTDTGAHGGHDGSPAHDFKMVSIHSLTAFVLMFGLVGFLMLRNNAGPWRVKHAGDVKLWAVGVVAFATGLATMFIIAKIFQTFRKLQSDGTIHPDHAVGAEGSVYLSIRPGEIGKVQITVRGAMKIFDARANDPAASLKTGDPVKVVSTGDVLVVEKRNS